jgi:FKBP-type peptidyl-prolyl cis-trans isomerase
MKKGLITTTAALFALLPLAVYSAEKAGGKAPEFKTFEEKISYVLGREIGQGVKDAPAKIDINLLRRGIEDAVNNRPSAVAPAEEEAVKMEFSNRIQQAQEKKIAAQAEANLKAEEAFLAKNKDQKGIVTTASGLQYEVLKEAAGAKPKEGDKVKVNYRGKLIDGREFDSSYARNQPAVFPVKGVIPGWTEALQLMPVGSAYRIFIPSRLAYGERGAGGGAIGPNQLLIFEVELLEIVP